MILFEDVDPNRVFLVGFSAGGDGAFRLSNRLAQRFAGVNIGGDPGDVDPTNLMNVPACLQVGEQDEGWVSSQPIGRCKDVARFGIRLDGLARDNPTFYVHGLFIHPTGPWIDPVANTQEQTDFKHNGWERGNFRGTSDEVKPSTIIDNYADWLKVYD